MKGWVHMDGHRVRGIHNGRLVHAHYYNSHCQMNHGEIHLMSTCKLRLNCADINLAHMFVLFLGHSLIFALVLFLRHG